MTEFERKHPLAHCEVCPLYEDSVFVPSWGPEKADIALVGEAPGLNEARDGIPFVGASGQLLNQVLRNAGLERDDIFITNTCLCRPKDNATPSAHAIQACRDRLNTELRGREPKVVVTLGNVASQSILQTSQGITSLRIGPPKSSEILPGVSIIPTFHPAASLYNTSAFPDIVTDFQKVRPALRGEVYASNGWNIPEVRIFDDPHAARAALRELLNMGRLIEISLDIETAFDKDNDVVPTVRIPLRCIGISHRPGAAIVLGESAVRNEGVLSDVGELLRTKRIVAQNGKFDLSRLYSLNPSGARSCLYFDTMLAHYCLDERRGTHSLEQLGVEILGSPNWKEEFRKWGDTLNVPKEILYKYNAYDAVNTLLLKDVLEKRLASEGLTDLNNFLTRTSPTLMLAEMHGVAVDLEYNTELHDEISTQLSEQLSILQQLVESQAYNPNSWQQVKEALKRLFRVGVANTRAATIEAVQEKAAKKGNQALYDFCEAHLKFKKGSKSLGTYVNGIRERVIVGDDGVPRVHTTFLIHGTVTGRLSSSNPNLQNVTRGSQLRKQFVASSPGTTLVQADYGQAELRVVCCLARDAYLRGVLSDSTRDIHGEVATRFFGSGWTKEQRVRAKAVVFGLTYGREAFSLAMEHGWPVSEAQRYINQFFEVIPDTINWINNLQDQVLSGEDLVTPFGRHRRFWLITQTNKKDVLKEARAFLPQSTASDITLEAANRLARKGYWDLLRIPVHDALVFEIPHEQIGDMIPIIRATMEEVGEELFDGYVPFPVDIKIGRSWGDLE